MNKKCDECGMPHQNKLANVCNACGKLRCSVCGKLEWMSECDWIGCEVCNTRTWIMCHYHIGL